MWFKGDGVYLTLEVFKKLIYTAGYIKAYTITIF